MKWLIVIAALILVTLLYVYVMVRNAIINGHPHPIRPEIDHLSQAMQAYKERQIQFPPSMGNSNPIDRKLAFMRHIRVAFPNCAYGTFDAVNKNIGDAWGYNFALPDGALAPLNLNSLDQAESLVFWLAGFPTPISPTTKQPVAGRKMFGFHRDSDDPFKRDIPSVEGLEPLRFRTEPMFQFDPLRLVDNDHDGWPEYVPVTPSTDAPTAPYVYFDADCYADSINRSTIKHLCYPRLTDADVSRTAGDLAAWWGVAAPMALYFDPNGPNPTRWAKDTSFQIICAGLDGIYSSPVTSLTTGQRVPVFPSGQVFETADGFQTQHAYVPGELDNVTNLSNKSLDQARTEAAQ